MVKSLEIIGLGMLAVMTLSFVGAFQSYGIKNGTSELFWACAGGTLLIIIYRKMKRKQLEEKEEKEGS